MKLDSMICQDHESLTPFPYLSTWGMVLQYRTKYTKITPDSLFTPIPRTRKGGVGLMDVLKWAAIVFAAGFIGYFGKYLGKLLMERLHKGKREEPRAPMPLGKGASDYDHKIEKMRLKLEKKRVKKGTDSEASEK